MNDLANMYKLLKDLPKIEIQISKDASLPVLRVGICLWKPDESYKFLPTPPAQCPICGSSEFEKDKRLSAQLNPKFDYGENGLSYVMLVWVHPECFEDCIETDETEPIPW